MQDTRELDPGAGREWQTVLALTRNVDREALTVEELRFRLRDEGGTVYEPSADAGNGGTDLPPGAQVPLDTLVRGQLAFSVEEDSGPYELLIDASPSRLVRVDLASG